MKIRNLVSVLELEMKDKEVTRVLTSISHWVSAIFKAKEYVVGNPKDVAMLRRLETLKLVSLSEKRGQLSAILTKEGQELYQDFYGHGYYL